MQIISILFDKFKFIPKKFFKYIFITLLLKIILKFQFSSRSNRPNYSLFILLLLQFRKLLQISVTHLL